MGQLVFERTASGASPDARRDAAGTIVDDDAFLVDGLRRGSEEVFALLVRRHQAPMLRVAGCYVGSRATAEDVVQETWLAVLRGVDRFDGRATLKTWMYRILTNRAKTAGQREARTVVVADMAEPAVARRPGVRASGRLLEGGRERNQHRRTPEPRQRPTDERLIAEEAVGLVVAVINELPRAQRLVITLRDFDGWSAQEVCEGLGLSEANQRVLLHRARAKVRARCATYFTSAN